MRQVNGKCIFLKGKNNCKIYSYRPKVCKQYPFFGRKVDSCKPVSLKELIKNRVHKQYYSNNKHTSTKHP